MNDRTANAPQQSTVTAFYGYASALAFKAKTDQVGIRDRLGLVSRALDWFWGDETVRSIVLHFDDLVERDQVAAADAMLEQLSGWMDGLGITGDAPDREAVLREQTPTQHWPERSPVLSRKQQDQARKKGSGHFKSGRKTGKTAEQEQTRFDWQDRADLK